jgi:YVTN family beta-propeller protein
MKSVGWLYLFLLVLVFAFSGCGEIDSKSNSSEGNRITISGQISPPEGVPPDSLTIVSLEETYSVSETGYFSTQVYREGVTIVTAMPDDKAFGLMNLVVTSETTGQAMAATSNPTLLNSKTTAVSMVFLSPFFSTNDPDEAADLIDIIENDALVASLADVIESVFDEDDPFENPTLRSALGDAIASVLDTLEASVQSATLSTPPSYTPKAIPSIQLPRRSVEFSQKLTVAATTPYSIDTDFIQLDILEGRRGFKIDVDSRGLNAVDWIGEVVKLDASQFISLADLESQATNRFNYYDRESTVGTDRASAKGIARFADPIGLFFDWVFSTVSSNGVIITSNTDAIYIVRSFSGGGWSADSVERDFLSVVENGESNDAKAFSLNIISAAIDGASIACDWTKRLKTPCVSDFLASTVESLSENIYTATTVEDLVLLLGRVKGDIYSDLLKCAEKKIVKFSFGFLYDALMAGVVEATKFATGYKYFEIASKAGKILERAFNLYFMATPIESVFVIVGEPFGDDVTAPTRPTNLTASAVSSSQIDLSWDASTDDVGVMGYNIYRNGAYLKSVTATSASDTGLDPDTEYCYTASAYDAAGNESEQSYEGCATTGSTPNISPTVSITSPSTGSTHTEGDSITFSGSGSDAEDGTLTGSSLVWTSSVDGQIGTGTSFTRSDLSVGTHTITLTATDGEGATGSDSVSITISSSSHTVIDTVSVGGAGYPSGVAVTPDGSYVYVTNQSDDAVVVIQTSDNSVIDTISVGDRPNGVAVTPNGSYVYVTNWWDNTVYTIRTSDNTVIDTIAAGACPWDVIVTPDGSYAYVVNSDDDTVSVIRTSDSSVIDTIAVDDGPKGLAVTPNGSYVYVTNCWDGTVSVIQTSDNSVIDTISGSSPYGVAVTPDGSYVYVTNYDIDMVAVIQTSDNSVIDTISVGNGPRRVAVAPSGSYVYAVNIFDDTLSVIRTSDNTVIDTVAVGNQPVDVAVTPDGSYVYVVNQADDTVSVIAVP